jgi:hypothetical protein
MQNMFKIFFLLLIIASTLLIAQNKSVTAVKVSSSPKIDGHLIDDVWKQAIPIKDFLQKENLLPAHSLHY